MASCWWRNFLWWLLSYSTIADLRNSSRFSTASPFKYHYRAHGIKPRFPLWKRHQQNHHRNKSFSSDLISFCNASLSKCLNRKNAIVTSFLRVRSDGINIIGLCNLVLRIFEVPNLDIALSHKCVYAVIDRVKIDSAEPGQWALALFWVFFNFSNDFYW